MPTIPSLDYYRVDRAAKLIGCEISDLIHWGAVGKIKVCVMLDMTESVFYSSMDLGKINDDVKELPNLAEEFKILSKNSLIYNDDSIYIDDLGFFCEDDVYNRDSENDGSLNIAYGHASGLWELDQITLMKIEVNGHYDGKLIVLPSGDMNLEGFFCCLVNYSRGCTITLNELWVTKEHVERIISNNIDTIVNNKLDTKGVKSIKLSKVVSERHAKKREAVLVAAIFCKENYPVECSTSIRSWANCIEKYASDLLHQNDGSPLSLDRIERILGKAIIGKSIAN